MSTVSSLTKSRPRAVPDEAAVALCIYGVDLVPEQISDLLGAKPTHSHRLGDKEMPKSRPYPKGAWILELRRIEPIDLDALYEELFASLPTDERVWKELVSRFKVRIDLSVHTDSGCGFYVSPKTMHLIAAKQAEFYLDIHAYGADEA